MLIAKEGMKEGTYDFFLKISFNLNLKIAEQLQLLRENLLNLSRKKKKDSG